jgi:uncharacterized protein YdhG (YjbR/CyaY superfamily)
MKPKSRFHLHGRIYHRLPTPVTGSAAKIRETIKKLAPEAREKISYQIAAFELNGRNLVYFAGWKRHVRCTRSRRGMRRSRGRYPNMPMAKGTLKFPLDEPLPVKLIERVIKLHLAVNKKQTKSYI